MSPERETNTKPDVPGISSVAVLFGRLMWLLIGPFALLGLTYGIVSRGTGWLTNLDAGYFVVIALMVLGRWHEQRSGMATTAEGKPATWDDFRRYVKLLIPAAAGIWVAANVVGNHVLKGAP